MFHSKFVIFLLLNYFCIINCVPYQTINANTYLHDDDEIPHTELQLVQVVFRHGDRTPDQDELLLYPANPYINETFEPFGIKAVTSAGIEKEYKIGLYLRSTYNGFLSEEYLPNEIYVRTTDFDRSKMSALACLAGLYPPVPSQQWNPEIMWQPIPYDTVPYGEDDMMYYYTCPRFLEARLDHLYSAEFQEIIKPYAYIFDKISIHTGRKLVTPEDVFFIDNLLQSEQNYNLEIPQWAHDMMSEIKQMTILEYQLEFATDELKKIGGGQMLHKMIQDARMKINGTLTPSGRKMLLYSGHENNVAAMLACSGVFEPHQPPYGSTYILELHKMLPKGNYAFRVIYLKHITGEPKILPIPDCGEFCDVDRFYELTKHVLTTSFIDICVLKHPDN